MCTSSTTISISTEEFLQNPFWVLLQRLKKLIFFVKKGRGTNVDVDALLGSLRWSMQIECRCMTQLIEYLFEEVQSASSLMWLFGLPAHYSKTARDTQLVSTNFAKNRGAHIIYLQSSFSYVSKYAASFADILTTSIQIDEIILEQHSTNSLVTK